MKKNILFLCTGNSCRSQMAEGLCCALKTNKYNAYSAGLEIHELDPYAVKVMKEIGIDISDHYSKLIEELKNIKFDIVLTVCDHAKQTCPSFSNTTEIRHKSFQDPPSLTKDLTNEEDILDIYRIVRNKIKDYIEKEL